MHPDVNMWASVWHRVEPVLLQLEGSVHRCSVLVVTSASTINERKNRSNESGMV